jgi:hypothetical protein
MKGQKYCHNPSDIKAVCPKCKERFFFPVEDYENSPLYEALKKERTFDLHCPWCPDGGFVTVDLTSTQEWYGDPNAKPEPKDVYDVIYFEWDYEACRKFEEEVKEKFPDAELEDASDDIHGSRTSVRLGANKRKEYIQWLITSGYAALSFHINMVITNSSYKPKPFDMDDDLAIIKETLKGIKV